jgi:hypothetical protein
VFDHRITSASTGRIEDTLRIQAIYSAKTSQHLVKVVRGKAIPLQAWRDPEGSRRLRLSDFKTIGT